MSSPLIMVNDIYSNEIPGFISPSVAFDFMGESNSHPDTIAAQVNLISMMYIDENKAIKLDFSTYYHRKEKYFITAINNLRKKINFIVLTNDYQNGDITEKQFEDEIENNPRKYVVDVAMLSDSSDVSILDEIVSKIEDDITVDEAAEIFSVDLSKFK